MTNSNITFHRPAHLNVGGRTLDYNKFAEAHAEAKYALGLLEGSQKKLQNPSLLISPLTAKEATVSSRIEGTQSTVSDVFLYEAGGEPRYPETFQVANYRQAMAHALNELQRGRSVSIGLIKSIHKILLTGVRHKGPLGQFRNGKVWIAEKDGDPIEKAIYIPPEAHFVQDYMDNLIEYFKDSKDGALIKAGLIHYQFEAVHPFDDGNGRLGRLLIPLIIHHEGKLSAPILYLSGYFDAHRDEYLSALHDVDRTGRYEKWLNFFLHCVGRQINETQKLVESIYGLYDATRSRFRLTKSPYLLPFIDFLFLSPIFTLPQAQAALGSKAYLTANRLVKLFQDANVIRDLKMRRGRAKLYAFTPLINLLQ